MARKFIISNNTLKLANVEFHFELCNSKQEKVKGGGYWHINQNNKRIYLYGTSIDYGSIEPSDLNDVQVHYRWDGYELWFTRCEDLVDVLQLEEDDFFIKKLVEDGEK